MLGIFRYLPTRLLHIFFISSPSLIAYLTIRTLPDFLFFLSYQFSKIIRAGINEKDHTYGEVKQLLKEHTAEEVSIMLGMSRRTLYRHLKEYEDPASFHIDSDKFY